MSHSSPLPSSRNLRPIENIRDLTYTAIHRSYDYPRYYYQTERAWINGRPNMPIQFADEITTEDQLRGVLGYPVERAANKAVTTIDEHCRAVIERSPFMLIASADADGIMDISPKGDPPGFVQILDEKTLAIPDRKGNRRADTFTNILANPKVALYFLIPGVRETLRVMGAARIVRDLTLRESMAERGSVPDLVIVVDIVEAFFHCAKCIIRSGLWESDEWADTLGMPAYAQVLSDHSKVAQPVAKIAAEIEANNVKNLY